MTKKSAKRRSDKNQPGKGRSRRKKEKSVSWRYLAAPIIIAIGGVALLGYLAMDVDTMASRANLDADRWAVAYWSKPIPPQGTPPAEYLPAAKGLLPEDILPEARASPPVRDNGRHIDTRAWKPAK